MRYATGKVEPLAPKYLPIDMELIPERWVAIFRMFGITEFLAISKEKESKSIGSIFFYVDGGSFDSFRDGYSYYVHNGFMSVINGHDMNFIGKEYIQAYNLKYGTTYLHSF